MTTWRLRCICHIKAKFQGIYFSFIVDQFSQCNKIGDTRGVDVTVNSQIKDNLGKTSFPCTSHCFLNFLQLFQVQTTDNKANEKPNHQTIAGPRLLLSTKTSPLHATHAQSNVICQYYLDYKWTTNRNLSSSDTKILSSCLFCVHM